MVWEGLLSVPVDGEVDGWIAVRANATARLYIDNALIKHTLLSSKNSIQSIISPRLRSGKNMELKHQ